MQLRERLRRHARLIALIILAAVTLYGVRELASAGWDGVLRYLRESPRILAFAVLWSIVDVGLECCSWMWVYSRLDVPIWTRRGAAAYLTGRAGLLLPAQLGRLIRPDSASRLGKAPLKTCLKAEAVVFLFDSASVLALIVGLLALKLHPLAALAVFVAVAASVAALGDWITGRMLHRSLSFPAGFWWSWQTPAIVLVQLCGWIAYGMALWVMVGDLPSDLSLWDVLFYSSGTSVLGVSTGLPGGIGATELLLGISLKMEELSSDYMVVIIAAFRIVTLWIWIPIGWLALVYVRRRVGASAGTGDPSSSSEPADAS